MRFPQPYFGIIEAEAAAKGISVPELCRRIIIERNQAAERERKTVSKTPTPAPSTTAYRTGEAVVVSSTPSLPEPSREVDDALTNAMATGILSKVGTDLAGLSPPTRSSMIAKEALVKMAETHPEDFARFITEMIAEGKMSQRELAEFVGLMGF